MDSLRKKIDSETVSFDGMRIGDWELNRNDSLSPFYDPSLKHMAIKVAYSIFRKFYSGKEKK